MIRSGYIFIGSYTSISDKQLNSKGKRYKSKYERNKITKSWEKEYALKDKIYYITILPDEDMLIKYKEYSGYIYLYIDDKFIDCLDYKSIEQRNDIIKNWIDTYDSILTINIIPNE